MEAYVFAQWQEQGVKRTATEYVEQCADLAQSWLAALAMRRLHWLITGKWPKHYMLDAIMLELDAVLPQPCIVAYVESNKHEEPVIERGNELAGDCRPVYY